MNLADSKLKRLNDPRLTPNERALLRCRIAAELIHIGKYEEAREALGDLWQGIGKRPALRGLATSTAGEVLLQCGVLSVYLGSGKRTPDAPEKARILLSEALHKFQSQNQQAKAAETQYELGKCYFDLGTYSDARIVLDKAIETLQESDAVLKAKIFIRRTLIEIWTGRYYDAITILKEAQPFFESCGDVIKGRWHGHMALAWRRLATAEGHTDYADRAIMEFTAAAHYFEQAHHEGYSARALNNLAMLLYRFGRHEEAHENLDRAAAIFSKLNDEGSLAQVKDTRARVLTAEGRYREANNIIAEAIQTFEKGSEYGLLADALTIQGVVWARLRLFDSSIQILRRAMSLASESGALSNAGLTALTLIEEHGAERLSESSLYSIYQRADEWLRDTQDAEEIARLRACAGIVIRRLSVFVLKPGDENFSMHEALRAYEGKLIEDALEAEGGSVTKAARRLSMSHQLLIRTLNTRHKGLLHKRTTPVVRRRSVVKKSR
ncbi:MAG TPA: tetratricopeptide repeat protein [Pyrinomonadaceae bacterium]|jgi:tetratricopeptide (TPR) repeat protein